MSGEVISQTEIKITSIEQDGFWMLIDDQEYFISFEQYPDFCSATLDQIFNFRYAFEEIHWPDMDIDIELDALRHPERFPLKFRR